MAEDRQPESRSPSRKPTAGGSQVKFDNNEIFSRDIAAEIGSDERAHAGAAGMLRTPEIITTAARLLAAEAEHAGSIHTQVARLKIPSSPIDGADLIPPPSGKDTQYLSIHLKNGLVATRTAGQVLHLAFGMQANAKRGGFFPTGLNGAITMSSDAATEASFS